MDANATNYNANATIQGYDQWGNLQCVYASCDDIPEFGCIYPDGFGAFNEGFDAADCSSYGGTPCEEASSDVSGCTDPDASNYNAAATVDDNSCGILIQILDLVFYSLVHLVEHLLRAIPILCLQAQNHGLGSLMKMRLFIHLLLAKVDLLLSLVLQTVLLQMSTSDLNIIHTLTLSQATIQHRNFRT